MPDGFGRGATFTWVSSPLHLRMPYGLSSAVRHLDAGLRAVADVAVRTRWDVDTLADLTKARFLGVGSHTSTVLNGWRRGSRDSPLSGSRIWSVFCPWHESHRLTKTA